MYPSQRRMLESFDPIMRLFGTHTSFDPSEVCTQDGLSTGIELLILSRVRCMCRATVGAHWSTWNVSSAPKSDLRGFWRLAINVRRLRRCSKGLCVFIGLLTTLNHDTLAISFVLLRSTLFFSLQSRHLCSSDAWRMRCLFVVAFLPQDYEDSDVWWSTFVGHTDVHTGCVLFKRP